jgi:hypothetical protein
MPNGQRHVSSLRDFLEEAPAVTREDQQSAKAAVFSKTATQDHGRDVWEHRDHQIWPVHHDSNDSTEVKYEHLFFLVIGVAVAYPSIFSLR